ncbi:MAG: hypothetical protein HYR55_03555 [Acidobacteria bacterium]|nr:hypothetical protein [Acidobacteriota bacterium]MBI3656918.1 hypothetical protein [Acidobacteriota bacterium]
MPTYSPRPHRRRTGAGFLLALAFVILFITAGRSAPAEPPATRTLTLEDRVRYQRAIEEVNWQYRLWPKENPQPKPALAAVMPLAAIRAKVEDDLRKSQALEVLWRRPVTGAQLQAEMARMARQTKQPERLRALWAALGNDPFLIAECLARPQLVNRLIRSWYAGDERWHGSLKKQAAAEAGRYGAVEDLRQMSGTYEEVEWVRKEDAGAEPAVGTVALDAAAWREQQQALDRVLARPPVVEHKPGTPASAQRPDGESLPVGVVSGLQEGEDGYYVLAVLEQAEKRMRVATVTWRKRPFTEWWAEVGRGLKPEPRHGRGDRTYQMPALRAGTVCTLDTWTPTPAPPEVRAGHTAVWTGTEMIVWGGLAFPPTIYFNTGGRYNPTTDTWAATSLSGVPSTRYSHTAVWTETEMIIWGGDVYPTFFNTGGRYDPATDTWAATSVSGAPSARSSHMALWTGTEMIVWGGLAFPPTIYFNTGGRYDPASDIWAATSVSGAPSARYAHKAVWTGTEMIVWGGCSPSLTRGPVRSGHRHLGDDQPERGAERESLSHGGVDGEGDDCVGGN